ncbi:MAG: hypothetical protein JNL34_06065, partial [Anaerolineae bacterium]|nr:hypothetical protein [Anaerolineae bacterium]
MRSWIRCLLPAYATAFLLLLMVAPASAAIVLSNNISSGSHLVNFTSVATGFTVPAGGDQLLTSVTVNAAVNNTIVASQIDVRLYSDSSGVPGSQIAYLGYVNPGSTSFSDFTFSPSVPPVLTAGTTYWIHLGGFNFRLTYGDSAPAGLWTSTGTKTNPGTGWADLTPPFYVRLNADPAPVTLLSINRNDPLFVDASSVSWTVTFSGSITNLNSTHFGLVQGCCLTGAYITGVSGSGAVYTVTANTGSGNGALGLNMINGNGLTPGVTATFPVFGQQYNIDHTPPTPNIYSSAPSLTKISPIPAWITFNSGPVTGFNASQIVVGNGTISDFVEEYPGYFTFNVTPLGQGLVTLNVPAGVVQDLAGHPNLASALLSRTFDSAGPTVTLSTTASDPTLTSPIPVTAVWGESVTGFTAGDVAVTNGTVSNFSGSGTTYTFDVTPSALGLVTVNVPANAVLDAATNGSTAAIPLTRMYGVFPPSVTINTGAPDPTNTSPIPVTVTFSAAVTGFDAVDVVVGNGAAGNFAGSGAIYTFDVAPAGQGTVTVDVPANVAQDSALLWNTAAAQLSRTYDSVGPTATLTSSAPDPTNTSPIPVTVTFSEAVSGFTLGGVTVGNGTAGNFAGSGAIYTFDVAPAGQGTVTVDVAAGVVQDAAGNGNAAAAQLSRVYDSVGPTATLTSSAPDPTNTSPIPVTVTFSEAVSGFTLGDVTVGNGTAGNFAGSGAIYTFDVTPAGQGTVTVDVAAGVVQDVAGNGNTAAAQLNRTYDNVGPTATLTSSAPDPTNSSPIPVTMTFSESVSGFTAGDMTVGNGSVANFSGSGAIYTFDITPIAAGIVTVDVTAGVAQDTVGNGNIAATQLSVTYDGDAPGAVISSTATNPTGVSLIPVTVTFSESVTGFTAGGVTIGNGSLGNFAGSGAVYTFDVTAAAAGSVTVDVAANSAQDAAGNGNAAAARFGIVYNVPGLVVSPGSISLLEGATGSYQLSLTTTPATTPVSVMLTFDSSDLTVNGSASPVVIDLSDATAQVISVQSLVNAAINTNRTVS